MYKNTHRKETFLHTVNISVGQCENKHQEARDGQDQQNCLQIFRPIMGNRMFDMRVSPICRKTIDKRR